MFTLSSPRRRIHRQKGRGSVAALICQLIVAILGLEILLFSFVLHKYAGFDLSLHNEFSGPSKIQIPKIDTVRNGPVSAADNNTGDTGTNRLELKCQKHPAWGQDLIWRNAILEPKLCISAKKIRISMRSSCEPVSP